MSEQLDMLGERTQEELRAALVERARAKGFRVAEEWERLYLPPHALYRAGSNGRVHGPVFVRIAQEES